MDGVPAAFDGAMEVPTSAFQREGIGALAETLGLETEAAASLLVSIGLWTIAEIGESFAPAMMCGSPIGEWSDCHRNALRVAFTGSGDLGLVPDTLAELWPFALENDDA
ncbi:MAG TPA: hypothetical protein VGG41_07050 [Solirubrobacteraceae bacterium]|jgi:hypothetical protein